MNEEPDLDVLLDNLQQLSWREQAKIMLTALRNLSDYCHENWAVDGPEIAAFLMAAAGGKLSTGRKPA